MINHFENEKNNCDFDFDLQRRKEQEQKIMIEWFFKCEQL